MELSNLDRLSEKMNNLVSTIIAAVILMVLVVLALGIGRLLSGKNRLKKGCGLTPKDKGSCPTCGAKKSCEEKEENDDEHSDK